MDKGYQIVEPAILDKILWSARNPGMVLASMSWIVDRVRRRLEGELTHADVEVIPVNYFGVYVAICIHYRGEERDLGPMVENAAAEVVASTPLIELLEFVAQSEVDWAREYEAFEARGLPRPTTEPTPR